MLIFWVIGGVTTVCGVYYWSLWRQLARAEFIRSYNFPRGLLDKLHTKRPELDVKQMQLVTRALRQFFLAHLLSGRKFVSMPSQVTDDLWHEFILYTRNYNEFCRRAFGRFMHHTPAVVLGPDHQNNTGLRRAWWYACKDENIDPKQPTRLPLLFAIDAKLGIGDGCNDPVKTCSGVNLFGDTREHIDGRRDQAMDGPTQERVGAGDHSR